MSTPGILFLFCILAIGSLVFVSLFNQRERRQRLNNKRLKQLRRRAQLLEELVVEVDQLLESRAIPRLINDELLELTLHMKDISPDATYLEATYQAALTRGEALLDEATAPPPNRLRDSDMQIAKAKQSLEEAAAIVRRQQGRGKITPEELTAFIDELSWAHLMVEVISYIGQGHRKIQRKDFLSAHTFYKKAQQLLLQSNHADSRRHRYIKELAEMLHNKRASISTDIMPEAHLNPTPRDTQIDPDGETVPDASGEDQGLPH